MSQPSPAGTARATGRWLTLVYAALVLVATLVPDPGSQEIWIRGCVVCGPQGWADAIRNVVLFVPLGLGLAVAWTRPAGAVALCVVLTLGIEGAQTLIPGRDSSLGDILFNAAGGGLGAWLGQVRASWWRPGLRAGSRLAWIWTALALTGAGLVGWAANHSSLVGVPIGQWTPEPRGFERYPGAIHEVRIGALEVPGDTVPQGRAVLDAWRAGDPVVVRFSAARPEGGPYILLRVVDVDDELLSLMTHDVDLSVRFRSRFADARLHDPLVWFPQALDGLEAGMTVDWSVWRNRSGTCLSRSEPDAARGPAPNRAEGGGATALGWCRPHLTTGTAWTTLIPREFFTGSTGRWVTVLWLFALVGPVGWWAGSTAGALAGGALSVVSASVAGFTLVSWSPAELLLLIGFGVGGGLARALVERWSPRPSTSDPIDEFNTSSPS